jgi:ubiquinone/menaquinone biosynthesis C-methylase UbiE
VNEFTGERVIPGQVEDDLWAEHIARYAFAARFVAGKRVLDVGCGTGYGTAELAKHATEAIGVDIAEEAIVYAAQHYRSARFLRAPAEELPFDDACFDVVTSFELIEHLGNAGAMLAEVRRVLHPAGVFVVSTPNKLYYAEARGTAGPNPFHAHEFEYAEFARALREFFPQVEMRLQDRMEAFGFYASGQAGAAKAQIARATDEPTAANFFIAICSGEALPAIAPYLYVPSATNLLRERETHIHKLEDELVEVRRWLKETTAARDALLKRQDQLEHDIEDKTRWARELGESLQAVQMRVVELQDQYAAQQAEAARVIEGLNADVSKSAAWALETGRKLEHHLLELANTVKLLDQAEATVVQRTEWAQSASEEAEELHALLEQVRQSRWVKLGRAVKLGPDIGIGQKTQS